MQKRPLAVVNCAFFAIKLIVLMDLSHAYSGH
jgi:hypothetical protein